MSFTFNPFTGCFDYYVAAGGGMVYPGAGIALSKGSSWDTSITNNSANWNTAYGWGNHAGLYLLLHGTADAVSGLTITAGSSISGSNTGDQTLSGLGGANTALSNLASVAINTSLIPGSGVYMDVGSSTYPTESIYLGSNAGHLYFYGGGGSGSNEIYRSGYAGSGEMTITGDKLWVGSNEVLTTASSIPPPSGYNNTNWDSVYNWYNTNGWNSYTPSSFVTSAANPTLSNLASVAINTSLISDADSTDDLGGISYYWANGYIDSIYTATLYKASGSNYIASQTICPYSTGSDTLGADGSSNGPGWTALYLYQSGSAPGTNGQITYYNGEFNFFQSGAVVKLGGLPTYCNQDWTTSNTATYTIGTGTYAWKQGFFGSNALAGGSRTTNINDSSYNAGIYAYDSGGNWAALTYYASSFVAALYTYGQVMLTNLPTAPTGTITDGLFVTDIATAITNNYNVICKA